MTSHLNTVFLLKEGEIVLKGLNKSIFENCLLKNIKQSLCKHNFTIKTSQSTILIQPEIDSNLNEMEVQLSKIFGISKFCRAILCNKNIESIQKTINLCFKTQLENAKTFKVCARRSDKKFNLNSQQICQIVGENVLNKFHNLSVDLSKNSNLTIFVEIRTFGAYVYCKTLKGAGGLPVGCGDFAMLLISGGIDSPVAGWLMAKRGVKLNAVHFFSPPYTSVRALNKVENILKILCEWTGKIGFFCVNFTEIQETIKKNCNMALLTIINRRCMNKIAELIAKNQNKNYGCKIRAIVNGESLGQVASQTLAAIYATKNAIDLPILQPLIGLDKIEIVNLAKQIGTFETSILPFEDCCTVFLPPHPKTKPNLDEILKNEQKIPNLNELIQNAANCAEFKLIY